MTSDKTHNKLSEYPLNTHTWENFEPVAGNFRQTSWVRCSVCGEVLVSSCSDAGDYFISTHSPYWTAGLKLRTCSEQLMMRALE